MFLADIKIKNDDCSIYNAFHDVISDFKCEYNLKIKSISIEDGKLKYRFEKNDLDKNDMRYKVNLVTVSLSMDSGFTIVILETKGTINEFEHMYLYLEDISKKHFKCE